MPKFRKKPIVIEAIQWFPDVEIEGVTQWPDESMPTPIYVFVRDGRPDAPIIGAIKTLEGWMIVSPGDWVITGIAGEKYPCKDSIFKMTYEPVEEDTLSTGRLHGLKTAE